MTVDDGAADASLQALLTELRHARGQAAGVVSWDLLLQVREAARRQLDPGDRLRQVLDSEDLAQDALLALIAAVDEFRGSTWPQLLAFVRALAQRRKIDVARRHRRLLDEVDDPTPTITAVEPPDAVKAPGSVLVADEERHRARALVAALPAHYREPLLRRLRGCDYGEIAQALEISEQTARKRVSRALRMLRRSW